MGPPKSLDQLKNWELLKDLEPTEYWRPLEYSAPTSRERKYLMMKSELLKRTTGPQK